VQRAAEVQRFREHWRIHTPPPRLRKLAGAELPDSNQQRASLPGRRADARARRRVRDPS